MEVFAKSVEELSLVVSNFTVGAVTFSEKKYYDELQRMYESFKIRKSQSLIGRAYRDQHQSTLYIGEAIVSVLSINSARILEREKIITECQQSALNGMLEISAFKSVLQNHSSENGSLEYLEIKSKIISNAIILENSVSTDISIEHGYENLLLKEKCLIKENQKYLRKIGNLKEKKDSVCISNPSSTSRSLQTVRRKLEQINFMRMLIVNLVGVMDTNLSNKKDLADMILRRSRPLLYHDLI